MSDNPKFSEPRRRRDWRPIARWIWLGAVVLAACLRIEVFESASAPPSPGWHEMFFTDNVPLQNVPVVVSVENDAEGMAVTVANEGTTTLTYFSAGRSHIQSFQEFEEWGKWTTANWDWCGTGKEEFELAPGERIKLAVDFWNPRRERMLAIFTERDTVRSGMVVLAAEGPRLTFDGDRTIQCFGAVFAAFLIWLVVRIVNARARWA